MCFQKYYVRFCTYCRSEFGEERRGELVRCRNYEEGYADGTCPPRGRPLRDKVRHSTICGRCDAHQREVEALNRAVEDSDSDPARSGSRRGGSSRPAPRGSSPPAEESRRRESPGRRRTRGTSAREQEYADAAEEEEAEYRYNRRREEMRRREEQRSREEYERYPTSDSRRHRDYY